MKLKSIPEDFVVTEISSFVPDPAGRFFVYELEKRSLATLEALQIIARHADVRATDLSAAGLKDKHGLTRQLFSSPKTLKANLGDERISLRLLGKTRSKLTAGSILGNTFDLTLRNLSDDETALLPRNIDEIQRFGIPNYYDNQRFGGIAHGQGFIAKALALGNFEEALRLHLAAPHRKQNLKDKQNRRLAASHWGDWVTLHSKMQSSSERALVEYLVSHPADWAGCFERITASLRQLFVAAYQSYLFNETLRRMVEAAAPEIAHVRNKAGMLAFWRSLPDDLLSGWRQLELPLLGPGTRLDDFSESERFVRETLASEGITLAQLSLEGMLRTSFSSATRHALVFPKDLLATKPEPDELNAGRSKLRVSFELPRGCFATIVTRRLVLEEDRV